MPTRDPTSLRDGDDAARLESALDALAARVSVWDRDLGFRYGNAAAVAFLGINGGLRGQPLSSFADPASGAAQMPYIERTLAGESLAFGRSTTAPGRLQSSYEEVRLEPLRVDGTITGILILVTDETELRRAEELARVEALDAAIRRERLKLAFALDADVQGDLTDAVDRVTAARRAAGAERDELLDRVAEMLNGTIARLRDRIAVLRGPLPEEAPRPGAAGQILHVPMVPSRSVQVRGQATLTPAQLVAVLDLLPEAVTIWSADFHNEFANAQARVLYGEPELEGKHGSEILGAAAYEASLPVGLAAMAGEPQSFVRTSAPGERVRHARVDYVGQFDGETAVGAVAVVRDVTEEVETQRRLERATRDAALAEDGLRIAEDLHDLVIQALFAAGLLVSRRRDDDTRLDDALDSIRNAQEHLRGAVLDLDTGSAPAVAAAEVVHRAVREVAKPSSVPVTVHAPDLTVLLPAPVALEVAAVATEAVSNALRHARASQVVVELTTEEGELVLTVTDDGRGLGRPERSSGLSNMATRAERRGGRLTFPEVPRGTLLRWAVPLEA